MRTYDAEIAYPPARSAWAITLLLTLLYVLSFVDRLVLVVLAPGVTRDLVISDAGMGFLLGAGFAIVFTLSAFPVARLLDRGERRLIVVAGVVLWSAMTTASAAAHDFWTLLLTRAGVAVGETVLTPAAISLIADMFPRERRVLPIALYTSVGGFMGAGAFIAGAGALDLATRLSVPAGMAPWRLALVIVGLPGPLLALLYAFAREPKRKISSDDRADFRAFVAHLRARWRFYLPFYLGLGFSSMISLGLVSWMPSYLVRHFHAVPATAGYWLGALGVPAGLAGAYLWPLLGRGLERRVPARGLLVALLVSVMGAGVLVGAVTLPLSMSALAPLVALAVFCTSATAVLAGVVVQEVGPPLMRARLMSLALLAFNIMGLGLGPSAVPLLARAWGAANDALGHGISALAIGAALASTICVLLALRGASSRTHMPSSTLL